MKGLLIGLCLIGLSYSQSIDDMVQEASYAVVVVSSQEGRQFLKYKEENKPLIFEYLSKNNEHPVSAIKESFSSVYLVGLSDDEVIVSTGVQLFSETNEVSSLELFLYIEGEKITETLMILTTSNGEEKTFNTDESGYEKLTQELSK